MVVVGPGAESEEIDLDQLILRELERGRSGHGHCAGSREDGEFDPIRSLRSHPRAREE